MKDNPPHSQDIVLLDAVLPTAEGHIRATLNTIDEHSYCPVRGTRVKQLTHQMSPSLARHLHALHDREGVVQVLPVLLISPFDGTPTWRGA